MNKGNVKTTDIVSTRVEVNRFKNKVLKKFEYCLHARGGEPKGNRKRARWYTLSPRAWR